MTYPSRTRRRIVWLLAAFFAVAIIGLFRYSSHRALPYKDQFAAGKMDEWTALGGSWQVNSGFVSNDSDDTGTKLVTGSPSLSNYRVTSDVRLTNASGDAGLIVRVRNAEEGTNAFDGYYAGIRLPDALLLGKMDYGFRPMAKVTIGEGVKLGVWYRLSVEAVGCKLIATASSLDGHVFATASATDTESCDETGAFGLRSFAAGGSWRNVHVEALP